MMRRTGLLLVNLGSPASPSAGGVRRFLAEFLRDRRVVELPRWLWWPVLYGIILWRRPRRTARAYREIWTGNGSPLIEIGRRQARALGDALRQTGLDVPVAIAMRYGQPAIAETMVALRDSGVSRLVVLPLYPQYSGTTTGSVYDAVGLVLRSWRRVPELALVADYHDDPAYIGALAASVRNHWTRHGRGGILVMSFHGIPVRYRDAGDPYESQCRRTAELLAAELALAAGEWRLAFQSRFGREPWLQPYTEDTLRTLPGAHGNERVDVICPGFAADCLETLEEINLANRQIFLESGGREFHYIACLNDDPGHIQALCAIAQRRIRG